MYSIHKNTIQYINAILTCAPGKNIALSASTWVLLACMVGQFLCTYMRTSVRTHISHMRLCSKYTHVTSYHARVRIQVPRAHSRSCSNFDEEPSTRRRIAEDAIRARVLARRQRERERQRGRKGAGIQCFLIVWAGGRCS